MMGPWTIQFTHLSGYGPVGCRNASCEPIELSFKVIPIKPPLLCPYRINVDSMKMSEHVELFGPQSSDLAETMTKRLLEGIPLT